MMDAALSLLARISVSQLALPALMILAIVLAARVARRAASRHVDDVDARYRLRKTITFVATILAVFVGIASFSRQLQAFTVAFGLAGAGVAFALQGVIASVAGWVAVTFGRLYTPGDRVQLGGITGDVIDVGVLRTTLMECGQWVNGDLYNGRIVTVANSFVLKDPVVNYTRDFPFLWDEIRLPVTFDSDRILTRRMLQEIVDDVSREAVESGRRKWGEFVRKYRIEDAPIEPLVHMVANDNWVEYTVRYVVDYRRRRATRDALFTRILDQVDASGGRIALASATVQVVGAPPLTVRLEGSQPTQPSAR